MISKFTHFKFAFILIEYFYVFMNLNLISGIGKCNLILLVRVFFFFFVSVYFVSVLQWNSNQFPRLIWQFWPHHFTAQWNGCQATDFIFYVILLYTLCFNKNASTCWILLFPFNRSVCLSICLCCRGGGRTRVDGKGKLFYCLCPISPSYWQFVVDGEVWGEELELTRTQDECIRGGYGVDATKNKGRI